MGAESSDNESLNTIDTDSGAVQIQEGEPATREVKEPEAIGQPTNTLATFLKKHVKCDRIGYFNKERIPAS